MQIQDLQKLTNDKLYAMLLNKGIRMSLFTTWTDETRNSAIATLASLY